MNKIKRELNPTKNKAHKEIISNFYHNSKSVYCVVGLEHKPIMEKLEIDYLILESVYSLTNISKANIEKLKKSIENKNIFFLTTNINDYLSFLKQSRKQFNNGAFNIYCFDLEVLKAMELIPSDELDKNDCVIGLKLPFDCTFKGYIDEIVSEDRYKPNDLYEYIKSVLEIEKNRQLKEGLKDGE